MRFLCWLVFSAAIAGAQIVPPQVGLILDSSRSIRQVFGFAGNLVVGDPIGDPVTTSTSVRWALDAAGQPVLLWSADDSRLLRWNGTAFDPLAIADGAVTGDVLSLTQTGDGVRFAIARQDGVWVVEVSAVDGSLISQTALPWICAPVLLQSSGELIYTDGTALVFRSVDGSERRVEMGIAMADLTPLGVDWIVASERASDPGISRQVAVRILPGRERVSQLPEIR